MMMGRLDLVVPDELYELRINICGFGNNAVLLTNLMKELFNISHGLSLLNEHPSIFNE